MDDPARTPQPPARPLVVGVGASAGGLEAVQAFLRGSGWRCSWCSTRTRPAAACCRRPWPGTPCCRAIGGCLLLMGVHLFLLPAAPRAFLDRYCFTFWMEWAAVWAFAAAWLTKGHAILADYHEGQPP